jgi:hypothetical protein
MNSITYRFQRSRGNSRRTSPTRPLAPPPERPVFCFKRLLDFCPIYLLLSAWSVSAAETYHQPRPNWKDRLGAGLSFSPNRESGIVFALFCSSKIRTRRHRRFKWKRLAGNFRSSSCSLNARRLCARSNNSSLCPSPILVPDAAISVLVLLGGGLVPIRGQEFP